MNTSINSQTATEHVKTNIQKISPYSVRTASTLFLLLALYLLALQEGNAQICQASINADFSFRKPIVQVGDTLPIDLVEIFSSLNACTVTNIRAWIIFPDTSIKLLFDDATLPPGGLLSLTDKASGPAGVSLRYVVDANVVGRGIGFSTNFPAGYTFGCGNPGQPNTIQIGLAVCGTAMTEPPSPVSFCATRSLKVNQVRFTGPKIVGSDFLMDITGGTSNKPCVLLTATNSITPTWVPTLTNYFNAEGVTTLRYRLDPIEPQRIFRLVLPDP